MSKQPADKPSSTQQTVTRCVAGHLSTTIDDIADETAIALVYNGISHVVMMSTPDDLSDLALGFSLSEGIIERASDISDIRVEQHELGIELHITISSRAMWSLKQQRRNMTGRTGCGLCGAESLAQAIKIPSGKQQPTAQLDESTHAAIQQALAQLQQHQPLQQLTGAVHGAAWCDASGKIGMIREDIGRHNALDKLIGALNNSSCELDKDDQARGFVLISSRASYEMIAKAHAADFSMLVAVSAPTALAIKVANEVGIRLVGFARDGRHTIYT